MRNREMQEWDLVYTVSFDRGSSHAVRIGYCGTIYEMEQGETRELEIEGAGGTRGPGAR